MAFKRKRGIGVRAASETSVRYAEECEPFHRRDKDKRDPTYDGLPWLAIWLSVLAAILIGLGLAYLTDPAPIDERLRGLLETRPGL